MSRRDFIPASVIGTGLGLASEAGGQSSAAVERAARAVGRLPRRRLGSGPREISVLVGAGTWDAGAVEAGIRCGVIRAFERLKKEGLARHLCLSQHSYNGNSRVRGGQPAPEILAAAIDDRDPVLARRLYSELSTKADVCVACGTCGTSCLHGLAIRERLAVAHRLLG